MVELETESAFYANAWLQLHPDREWMATGLGGNFPLPITGAQMAAWLDEHDVEDREERDAFFSLVRALDLEYLAWARDEQKPKSLMPKEPVKKAEKPAPAPPGELLERSGGGQEECNG